VDIAGSFYSQLIERLTLINIIDYVLSNSDNLELQFAVDGELLIFIYKIYILYNYGYLLRVIGFLDLANRPGLDKAENRGGKKEL
jgi:hypothetical protein